MTAISNPATYAFPCSYAQESLWLVDRINPGSAAYNVPAALRLRGLLDADALAGALQDLVDRHEMLRTTFGEVDHTPTQLVAERQEVDLATTDLSGLDPRWREAAARELATAEAATGFDLTTGPLTRTRLVRLAEQDHLLLITLHHIVADAWSVGVILRELGALFTARCEGRRADLPELPLQYADYAVWHRDRLDEATTRRLVEHWRGTAVSRSEPLELPWDRPRSAEPTGAAHQIGADLGRELTAALNRLAHSHGVSLFMVLAAGYVSVLHEYSRQPLITIGTPMANRGSVETEGLIGYFVNVLPIAVEVGDATGFGDLVGRVRDAALDVFAHQELPLDKLVEALLPERDRRRSPLFQAMFALQNASAEAVVLPGLETELWEIGSGAAKYDVSMLAEERAGGLHAVLEVNADVLTEASARRILNRWRSVLAVAADVAQPAPAPMLTGPDGGPATGVSAAVAAWARRTPDAAAVEDAAAALGYRDLDEAANRVANGLRALNVRAGDRVVLRCRPTVQAIAALLGIWRAGAAYVPVELDLPDQRAATILEACGATIVLTHADRIAAGTAESGAAAVEDLLTADPPTGALPAADPEGLAYVLFTSGSTGRPKGVMVPHDGLARYLKWAVEEYAATGQGAPVHSPLGFDLTLTSLLVPLMTGHTAVLLDNSGGVEELAGLLERRGGFSLLKLTPTHLEVLGRRLPAQRLAAAAGVFVVGGEVLQPSLADRVAAAAPEVRIVNEYGPTEAVVGCSIHTAVAADSDRMSIPIGHPTPGTRLYVVDRALTALPEGAPGELCIAGEQVSWGYLDAPALTAAQFVPDPYGPAGARMYRTGDLVRRLSDGGLEFLGRIDRQLKLRGFRIEPGEIEAVLQAQPHVGEATAIIRNDGSAGTRLVAYVTPGGAAPDPAALREAVAQAMPEYMVPAAIVVLAELPLTHNGKVDRDALPAPDGDAFARAAHEPPATATERAVAAIWTEVLGVSELGRADDFFALGGHSLSATGVVSRVRERLRADLPLRAFFDAPTLAGLSTAVDGLTRREHEAPAGTDRPDELSFAQQRLWFLDQLDPGSPLYNVPAALHLTGRLHRPALLAALGDLAARHEALRTSFPVHADGTGRPVVTPGLALPVTETDLTGLTGDDRDAEVRRRAAAQARAEFDLATAPLARIELIALARDEHVLLVTVHHIISDGWSVGVLLRDLGEFYRSRRDGTPALLPKLRSRYADHAHRLRDKLATGGLDGQLAYWRERLSGPLPVLDLPADRPREAGPRTGGELLHILDPALTRSVEQFSARHGVTPYVTMLAAFFALLHRHSGQRDLLVGSPVAGRTEASAEDLVGCFINMLVLRADVNPDGPFADLVRQLKRYAVDAYDNQDVPFERLVEETGAGRDATRTPLFQVMFGMQNVPAAMELPGLRVAELPVHSGTARFDLTMLVEPYEGGLRLRLEYDSGLFEPATARLLVERYEVLLRAALDRPATRIEALPVLAASEGGHAHAEVLPFPVDRTFTELFAEQVARTPDAIAAEDAAGPLTYAELAGRVRRVAGALQTAGVRPGDRVTLLLPRGTGFLASMLGVFQAGAAYVPLDPMYPAARLSRILAGSRAAVVMHAAETASLLSTITEKSEMVPLLLDAALATTAAPTPVATGPNDLAYVIFTSGSTGVPKGAMVEQAGMVNHLWAKLHDLAMTSDDVLVQNASVCFDISVWQFLAALVAGGRVVIVDDEQAHDPALLWGAAARYGATLLETVPSMLRAALADPALPDVPGLRLLMLTGEALPMPLVRQWLARSPEIPLVNAYGPTECSDDVTHAVLAEQPPSWVVRTPIGRPVPNLRLYVLTADGTPAPTGVPGELYVGGIGVGRGYLDDPAMTARRFVPDPYGTVTGGRLYRTGDLVRLTTGGEFEFLGRLDHQVKIRGHRLELGEVEAALGRHPRVGDCAAEARTDPNGEQQLVGYVVGDDLPDAAALRAHVAALLGDHMTPSRIVVLDALPLNANGKVDRNALPPPDLSRGAAVRTHVPPRDDLERTVCTVFADVLGVPEAGLTDDFFELGGHSLLAVRAVARLRAELGVEIALRTLFDTPVTGEFARLLRSSAGASRQPIPATAPGGREELSHAQQRMWFFEQHTPGTYVMNMAGAYRIHGDLDVDRFSAALTAALARHDTLHTRYDEVDGVPFSQVVEARPVRLAVHDLRALSRDERDDRLAELAEAESTGAFDLATGEMLRAALVHVTDDEWVLFVTVHHLAADGGSVIILLREVLAGYSGERIGEETWTRYADWARWQRDSLNADSVAYWRDRLAGDLPVLTLPADRPRTGRRDHAGALVRATVPTELAGRLRELSRAGGGTLFMTLLAGFQTVLHRLTGDRDFVVGTPVDGRGHASVANTVGCFINTLPIRVGLDPDRGFRTLLGDVREAALGAFAHQEVPFERIVAEVLTGRDLEVSPVFQVLFNMLDPEDPLAGTTGGLHMRPFGSELLRFGAKFDLTLYARDRGADGIELIAVHNALLFNDERIADLLERLIALLGAVSKTPDLPLAQLRASTIGDALLPDPFEPLAEQWHGGLVDRLATHARLKPQAPAVHDGRNRWTYQQLANATNATATTLAGANVGPGSVVAILAHQHVALPASVLGVLHAGAAFLLLDPRLPVAVLRAQIERSGSSLLLCPSPQRTVEAAAISEGPILVAAPVDGFSDAPARAEDPDALAYLCFTSGTTGEPRAVVGTQRPLTHFLDWHTTKHGLTADDRFAALSGPAHDPFLRDLFTPLWCGAELRLPDPGTVRDADRLAAWLAGNEITVAHLTPSLANLIDAATSEHRLPQLRQVFFGGEPLRADVVTGLAGRAPRVRATGFYGATETPQAMGVMPVDPDWAAEQPGATLPLGRGIPGVQLLILDEAGHTAGIGEIGEVVVRTPYLALGYHGDAASTAARFVAGPAGDRVYRTGDRGRYLLDGTVEHAGRADSQLKIRGYRVDPRDVEARLTGRPGVEQARVLPGRVGLHAHLVGAGDTAAVLAGCREELPEYLVPDAVTWWASLPLTANGKTDDAALAAGTAAPPAPQVAPRTDAEEAVYDIWCEVLPGRDFGVDDDFFTVGGHSLAAAQILARIRADFDIDLDLAALFDATTVAALAALIEQLLEVELAALTDAEIDALLTDGND